MSRSVESQLTALVAQPDHARPPARRGQAQRPRGVASELRVGALAVQEPCEDRGLGPAGGLLQHALLGLERLAHRRGEAVDGAPHTARVVEQRFDVALVPRSADEAVPQDLPRRPVGTQHPVERVRLVHLSSALSACDLQRGGGVVDTGQDAQQRHQRLGHRGAQVCP